MDNLIEWLNVFAADETAALFNYAIQIVRSNFNEKCGRLIYRKSAPLTEEQQRRKEDTR